MKKLLIGIAVCLFASFVGCSTYAEDAYESIRMANDHIQTVGIENAEMVQITNHGMGVIKRMDDEGTADNETWIIASEGCRLMSDWLTTLAIIIKEPEKSELLEAAADYSTAGDCFLKMAE